MIELLTGEDMLAMQHLTRWHMVRVRRHQTLAEHSATVATLAVRLAQLHNEKTDDETLKLILDRALVHDAHEIEYGDIPAVAKDFLPEGFDEQLCEAFWKKRGGEWGTTSAFIKRIIDLADKLEAYLFYSLEGEDKELREKLWISVQKKFEGMPVRVKEFVWSLAANVFATTFTPQPDKKPGGRLSVFDQKIIRMNSTYGKFGGRTEHFDFVSAYPSELLTREQKDKRCHMTKTEEEAYRKGHEDLGSHSIDELVGDRDPSVGVPRYAPSESTYHSPNCLANRQREIGEWADKVFPGRTAQSSLAKLIMEEVPEFLRNLNDPLEYADLLILVLDVAYQKGINVEKALIEKMEINKNRSWAKDSATGFWSHVDPMFADEVKQK